jgi:AraC family transcriptional activator of tynA and feaB
VCALHSSRGLVRPPFPTILDFSRVYGLVQIVAQRHLGETRGTQMNNATAVSADLEGCNDALSRICGAYRVLCERWWEFRGGIATRTVGSMAIADIRFSNGKIVKDRSHDERYLGDHYFLVLQAAGSALMRQRGSEAFLRPGDCTLIDSRYPSVFEIGPGFRQYSFHLSAQSIRDRLGAASIPPARTISGSSGAGGLLSDTLMSIVKHGETLTGVDVTDMTLQLLCKAVGVMPVTGKPACDRNTLNVQELFDYIDTQMHEPELAPHSIAKYFNVSLRQLYRIAAAAGYTPAALIWQRRLERARNMLTESTARPPITEVALSCGFKDGAHFSRSYRRAFGEPPRAARRSREITTERAMLAETA